MHVAVLGAGALGRVYGVRLAKRGNVTVDFVVREGRLADGAIWIERAGAGGAKAQDAREGLEAPSRVTVVPAHADVVIACVRADQLVAAVPTLREGPAVPVVVVAPMLPRTFDTMRAALGARVVAAMPSVTAYVNAAGVTRYWVSGVAKTLIDESGGKGDESEAGTHGTRGALVEALRSAGIDAGLELGVHETTPATTIAFLPLTLGLDIAGSANALLADAALVELMLEAFEEARAVGDRIGKVALWASLLTRFVGKRTLGVGIALARRHSPEGVAFVEEHFGRKVHAQNIAMGEEVAAVAEEKGVSHAAFDALLVRLRAAGS